MIIPHKEIFRHKWKAILPEFGLNLNLLHGKHGPCPFCGGKDRFRLSDYRGFGDWICNQCGTGDGIEFVKRALKVDFKEAVRCIEPIAANVKAVKAPVKLGEENRRYINSIWKAAEAITSECASALYLGRRIEPLRAISGQLKYHPRLAYTHENGTRTFHPAMIALVTDAEGKACNLHRTYLTHDGYKADVPTPKKLCCGPLPKGCAIRLTSIGEALGLAEGIETALAATALTGIPCWAAVNCYGIETWEAPKGVHCVTIFGDNDAHFVGQSAAYALARRLARNMITVNVLIPDAPGDWCDVFSDERRKCRNAA